MKITSKHLLLTIALISLTLSGCGLKDSGDNSIGKVDMDRLSADGKFHYKNDDLGFSIVLPAEFDHYQTQRTDSTDFSSLEFFVPTSDQDVEQKIPGYGRPIMVRVFNEDYWEKNKTDYPAYKELERIDSKVYTIIYWLDFPKEWSGKWGADMIREIENSIVIK